MVPATPEETHPRFRAPAPLLGCSSPSPPPACESPPLYFSSRSFCTKPLSLPGSTPLLGRSPQV
eukprot:2525259-Rhodomonas_salina.4